MVFFTLLSHGLTLTLIYIKAIQIQPSVIGYIAKNIAHVGMGEKDTAYQACDIAFAHFHLFHPTFLLLIKAIIVFMAREHPNAISLMDVLIATVQFNSICYVVQAYMYLLLGNLQMESSNYEGAIQSFEHAHAQMRHHTSRPLLFVSLISGWKFDNLDLTVRRQLCEALYAAGRTGDAGESLLRMVNALNKEVYMSESIANWVSDFSQRCLSTPGINDNAASNTTPPNNVLISHATLNLVTLTPLLTEWAKATMVNRSWKEALVAAVGFVVPRFTVYRVVCERLVTIDRFTDASECFRQLVDELQEQDDEQSKWVLDFKCRCLEKFESRGDIAMSVEQHDNAILHYSLKKTLALAEKTLASAKNILAEKTLAEKTLSEKILAEKFLAKKIQVEKTLVEKTLAEKALAEKILAEKILAEKTLVEKALAAAGLFIKRSKAYITKGLWDEALDDANMVITLDPLSPWGYERKYEALHRAGDYENAINAFEAMLSKMSQSRHPEIRAHYRKYVEPRATRATIQRAVQNAIRDSPRVLINTISGRLLDKSGQVAAFESLLDFKKLISSMTTCIDHSRIEHYVTQYFRYAMFSHKWDDNEPLFEKVSRIVVYDLEESLTHDKLQMFCKIARDAGLHWAWSDTCCINKADHIVLQEALVAMFKWYQGSTVTIILLRGVRSPSRRGDLVKSIWITRAWTFQEYHASKVVRFYNEDWTLYMNLDIPNHKESPEIISEMEEATGVSAQALMKLRPGLNDIREKLCLASTRETTFVEDAAYSLLGIFTTSLPVIYGEGDQAVGRLLAQLLTSSGDTSILAWTGKSGSFNSCLPGNITVFNRLPTSHIPPAITSDEMEKITARTRTSFPNLTLVMELYDRLHELPVPSFSGHRMKLPCFIFKLGPVSVDRNASGCVFRAMTDALGVIEIRTTEDLSRLDSLILVHPWIDFLLDRQPVRGVTERNYTSDQSFPIGELPSFPGRSMTVSAAPQTQAGCLTACLPCPFRQPATPPPYTASLRAPSPVSQTDKQIQALGLVARLRQPFGALLFTPTRRNVAEYRRVAAESLIIVQVEEITPAVLNKLVDGVRVLDVL
ncbi:hypothetical protein OG21DRAFT_1603126 [Imleria badia]|nr:hypothetical protein OG21DRAFT_1603126 [Imleria badia]